jgi:hypothetical protein
MSGLVLVMRILLLKLSQDICMPSPGEKVKGPVLTSLPNTVVLFILMCLQVSPMDIGSAQVPSARKNLSYSPANGFGTRPISPSNNTEAPFITSPTVTTLRLSIFNAL